MPRNKILLLDDYHEHLKKTKSVLVNAGYLPQDMWEATKIKVAMEKLSKHKDDIFVFIVDFDLGDCPNGLEAIAQARTINPDLLCILVSGGNIQTTAQSATYCNVAFVPKTSISLLPDAINLPFES